MNQKPTYRFEIKSKRTGKKIKHYINGEDYGFYSGEYSNLSDQQMKDIALGIVMALMSEKQVYAEVYKLTETGEYELIRTQF